MKNPNNTKLIALALTIAALALWLAAAVTRTYAGNPSPSSRPASHTALIEVTVTGVLRTGIVAIGGETTGTEITADNVTWELDLGGDQALHDLAKKNNKGWVVVTGTLILRDGVEVPERYIVKVKSLRPLK